MKLLGLGSPDKVQPLTEKAAIELGSELLGEFFVFGTAAGAILLEYVRQSHNKSSKDQELAQKVDTVDTKSHIIIQKLDENAKGVDKLSKIVEEQQKRLEQMNKKITELEKLRSKANGQSTQTVTGERPVGKILYPSNSKIKASSDVRNSIIYQSADNAVFALINKTIT